MTLSPDCHLIPRVREGNNPGQGSEPATRQPAGREPADGRPLPPLRLRRVPRCEVEDGDPDKQPKPGKRGLNRQHQEDYVRLSAGMVLFAMRDWEKRVARASSGFPSSMAQHTIGRSEGFAAENGLDLGSG